MRHNRDMFRLACLVCACWLLLAGCGPAPAPLPGFTADAGRGLWQGSAACADCDGIETELMLEQQGDARVYMLVETYRGDDHVAQFIDNGRWQRQAGVLQLRGEQGSRRSYRVLADGRLRASDRHGRALPMPDDAMLMPMAAPTR